ncbi:two pore potassium channel, partial [Acrasis kona]
MDGEDTPKSNVDEEISIEQSLTNDDVFCYVCQCNHPREHFKQNHQITDANVAVFGDTFVKFERDEGRMMVCDASYFVASNRHANHIDKNDDVNDVRQLMRLILLSFLFIVIAYIVLIAFAVVFAVPIWVIESAYERKTILMKYNGVIPDNYVFTWTYGNSVYFMIVTLTTIGYGDIIPVTSEGRAYMEVLVMFGLGLTGALIGLVGAETVRNSQNVCFLIIYCARYLVNKCRGRVTVRITMQDFEDDLKGFEKKLYWIVNNQYLQTLLLLVFAWAYILIGGAVLSRVEGYDWSESQWICFITITTIGYNHAPVTNDGKILFC